MTKTYNALEGDYSVRGAATVSRSGVGNSVAIVGGYDASNASSGVTAGEATLIDDASSASDTFGVSEIPRAAQAASANGVGTMYGVPVAETQHTETVSASSTQTLTNTPIFDPSVHPDHSITIKEDTTGDGTYDTAITTNVVYDTAPSQPSKTETANVNPINGEIAYDSSGDYEVTYTYGDYSPAIEAAGNLGVRNLIVCTESPSVKASLVSTLSSIAKDFDFKRAFVGAKPEIKAGSIGSYTPDEQHWRVVEVAPARATGANGAVRTCAAVGGFMSAQPIGPEGSGLYDTVNGLTSLNTEYRPSEVKNFDGVTALTRTGEVGTAVTTSTKAQFQNIYATEIIDEVGLSLFDVARDYAGGPQDVGDLETLLETTCQSYTRGSPPELGFARDREERPYDVNVTLGSSPDIANAGVTIVPSPIAETVNISLTVSDGFVQFGGAT